MACNDLILEGVTYNCSDIEGMIGVGKILSLINFSAFDRASTLAASNIVDVVSDPRYRNLINLYYRSGNRHEFEVLEYKVNPSIKTKELLNGDLAYTHSLTVTIPSKRSRVREVIESLAKSKVLAVVEDLSTGYKEVYGIDRGLKAGSVSRQSTGSQDSNFFQLELSTPSKSNMFETRLPRLFSDYREV
jgi:hypothetical protein